jgi:hypothetical protein
MDIASGDRLVVTAGGSRLVWTVHAVNNRVVKYLDENGDYRQMPVDHLNELLKNCQAEVVRKASMI